MMKSQVIRSKFVAGKVLVGPKIVGDGCYRIASQKDRSGRIERFDPQSRSWAPAPEDVTFTDVWRAPEASQLFLDLACALPAGIEFAAEDEEEDVPAELAAHEQRMPANPDPDAAPAAQ